MTLQAKQHISWEKETQTDLSVLLRAVAILLLINIMVYIIYYIVDIYSCISTDDGIAAICCNYIHWLVVYLPLWKIWVRQLGWLFHPIYEMENNPFMFQTTNQPLEIHLWLLRAITGRKMNWWFSGSNCQFTRGYIQDLPPMWRAITHEWWWNGAPELLLAQLAAMNLDLTAAGQLAVLLSWDG